MIDIQNISYRYPGQKLPVFSDFSLQLTENRVYGLLGKNGTGKSTLLYLIAGLLRAQKGSVSCDSVPTCKRQAEILSDMLLVSEEFELPAVSLDNYVKLIAPFYPRFSNEVLRHCLEAFELKEVGNLHALSMGQKKKAYMSIALAANTRYLLMDEPTNGLDIPSKSQFRKVVADCMSDDRTIIISTHQVHDVETLLDHVSIIDGSRVLLDDDMGALADKYDFKLIQPQDDTEDVLYAEPSLQGNMAILSHRQGEQTQVNLELLFNAVSKGAIKPESATSKSNAL